MYHVFIKPDKKITDKICYIASTTCEHDSEIIESTYKNTKIVESTYIFTCDELKRNISLIEYFKVLDVNLPKVVKPLYDTKG